MKDLPSVGLSPPAASNLRYSPVPSQRRPSAASTFASTSQRPATAPRTPVDATYRNRYHAGSVSSTSSCGSAYPHRPSISQQPTIPPFSNGPSSSLSTSALGLSLRQHSQGSFSIPEAGLSSNSVPMPSQTYAQPRKNSRDLLVPPPPLRRETPPTALSLTMPSSSEDPSIRFSASDLSDFIHTPPTGSPPVVNVQDSDGDASLLSTSLPSTFDFPLPPQASSASLVPSSSRLIGRSPPKRGSDDHLENLSGGSLSSSFPSSYNSALRSRGSQNSLTNFENLDVDVQIRFKTDGGVKAGSLAGLIDRLIRDTPGGYGMDQEFREVFLTTLRLFTTPEEVLKHLIHRYTLANEDQSMRVEDKVSTRYL